MNRDTLIKGFLSQAVNYKRPRDDESVPVPWTAGEEKAAQAEADKLLAERDRVQALRAAALEGGQRVRFSAATNRWELV